MRRPAYVMSTFLATAALLVACNPSTPPATSPASVMGHPARVEGRLSPDVRPLYYRLALDLDPNVPTFQGKIEVETEWAHASASVVLNSVGLQIRSAHILDGNVRVSAVVSHRKSHGSEVDDELVLTTPRQMAAGPHTIVLTYQSTYATNLAGLYRTKEDGLWYVFSQFESIDARRAFPCFDQPEWKTPFSIEVAVPEGLKAFSNAPLLKAERTPGKTHFSFAETKPLPTYLVAFTIGDLDVVEASPNAESTMTPIRLVATKGKGAMGARALTTTQMLVGAFERYLGVPFPYPKLDIVAVPDFAGGGMENAGLILCRTDVMTLDKNAPRSFERSQSRLLAHEIAHQWFGDLVTAKWWNDIWLNEAFASWAEATILGTIQPRLANRLDTIVDAKLVMAQDSMPSARPIRSDVTIASKAAETFDAFTYDKGAAVLEMIERWIGNAAFRSGLRTYFQRHAHQNATSADLFAALGESSKKPVTEIAQHYIDEPGSPLLHASRSGSNVIVKHWNDDRTPILAGHPSHPVPLCARTPGSSEPECALVLPGKPWTIRTGGAWTYPNAGESAYAQTVPDVALARELIDNVNQLDGSEQLGLIDGVMTGFEQGTLPFGTVDALFRKLDKLHAPEPRVIGLEAASLLRMLTAARATGSPVLIDLEHWIRDRAMPHKSALTWVPSDGEEMPMQGARGAILNLLAEVGDEATIREAMTFTSKWLESEPVHRDVLPVALVIAALSKDAPLEAMWLRARATRDPQIRTALLRASTTTGEAVPLKRALDRSLTDEVKPSELRYIFGGAFDNTKGHAVVYEWVKAHWEAINARASWLLTRRLGALFTTTCTQTEVDDARAFFAPRANPANARRIALGLESASSCVSLGKSALARAEVLQVLSGSR